jgi:hypothetical protein
MIWLLWLLHGWIVDGPPVPSIDKFGGVADGKKKERRQRDSKYYDASYWYGMVNVEDILACVKVWTLVPATC